MEDKRDKPPAAQQAPDEPMDADEGQARHLRTQAAQQAPVLGATQVEYRQGLPSAEDVRAHEAHGGRWMRRIGAGSWPEVVHLQVRPGGADILDALAGAAFSAIEIERPSDDSEHFPVSRWDLGREYRPCTLDADAVPWPGAPAAPPAPLPVVQGGEPSLDREALGRDLEIIQEHDDSRIGISRRLLAASRILTAHGLRHMGNEAGDAIVLNADEACRTAEAVASAVRKGEGLTHPDRLKQIADLVSGLPHGPGTPGPGLELGESAEAYELIRGILHGGAVGGLRLPMNGRDLDYVSVCINGLWIGASMPKTEGK